MNTFTCSALGGGRCYRQEVILRFGPDQTTAEFGTNLRVRGLHVGHLVQVRMRRLIARSSGFVANSHSVQHAWVDTSLGRPWNGDDRGHISATSLSTTTRHSGFGVGTAAISQDKLDREPHLLVCELTPSTLAEHPLHQRYSDVPITPL